MVKTPANTKGTTPVTTGGRSSARPRSADAATKATASTPRSVKFDRDDYAGRDYADPCKDLAAQVRRSYHHEDGVDIWLCIDYKLVNSVTAIMEYAMPLVDDLLTDMEKYLWYCSLDAASGFSAVMMTQRAQKISAFVCALGHFEWLRMPFGLKNAPMIYQRMIDNALWGFVQPRGGSSAFAERVQTAEVADTAVGGSPTTLLPIPELGSKPTVRARIYLTPSPRS
ncbi:unnamed protein product [Phytophthora fragariaefolia]|uniref:Unnamed protein product n=1 Tax=Phytophthora fragariaefolia TaxID=1490495 RepID=A0A9W6YF80_9STRA|nr:unnamed protein product [Phytophthora fragariaefolia]